MYLTNPSKNKQSTYHDLNQYKLNDMKEFSKKIKI